MKKAIADLWGVFINSIKSLNTPIERYAAGLGVLFFIWLFVYSLSALGVHAIVDLIEVIGTTITETVNGFEKPEI